MTNSKIKTYLDRLAESSSHPNSFLFVGQNEAEKEKAVFEFVSKIAGKSGDRKFFDRVKSKNHPDVVIVEPEIEEKKGKTREKEIGISQIRDVLERLKFFPYELKRKFCIIKKAQKMNAEASNALLKSLEEPTEKTIFILLANDAESILPTIVSRCAILRFAQTELPKWDEENREQFKKIFQEEIFERFEYAESISKNKVEMMKVFKDWELVMAQGLRKLIAERENRRKISKVIEMIENNRRAIDKLERTNAGARGVGEELLLNF
jgi:DNA polymerase III delta prime subunit